MRWSIRGVGLLSTLILARLLKPEDFGILAMASIVILILHTCSDMGIPQLLIRTRDTTRGDYDTGWTFKIIQAFVLAVLLFILAPYAADFYNESRVQWVLKLIALANIIGAFENIGIVDFRKNLQFDKDFRFGVFEKCTTVLVTVGFAFYLKTYWALVIGIFGNSISRVCLSYIMHPFRPRFSLEKWRKFISYSLQITPAYIAGIINQKVDVLVVGATGTTSQMGGYHVAREVATMTSTEIMLPIGRALFPTYATLTHEHSLLAAAYLNVLRTAGIICFAFGVGIVLVAEDFVQVLLGDQWIAAIPFVRWFGIIGLMGGLSYILTSQILIVTGNEKLYLRLQGIRLCFTVPSLVTAGIIWGPEQVAITKAITGFVYMGIAIYTIRLAIPIKTSDVLSTLMRPLFASLVMAMVVVLVIPDSLASGALRLLIDVFVGAISYLVSLSALWWLSGRPKGPESACFDFIAMTVQRTG